MRKEKENKKRRKLLPAMLAVALAAAMIVPMGSISAKAAQGDGTITMNVQDATDKYGVFGKDLTSEYTMVGFYQIAKGSPDEMYDTYNWSLNTGFTDLQSDLDAGLKGDSSTSEAYQSLAKKALDIIIGDPDSYSPSKTAEFGKASGTLGAGLYLAVPLQAVTDESGEVNYQIAPNDESKNVEVKTKEWIYTFDPILVSVPTKDADADGNINTAANYGDWRYNTNVQVVAKASRLPNVGSIQIEKALNLREGKAEAATFVFSVKATKNGDTVYDNMVSISHPNPTPIVIDNLPVGSTVTIKEEYTSPSYRYVSGIPADGLVVDTEPDDTEAGITQIITVTNTYNENHYHGGGGIENQYANTETEHGKSWKLIGRIINGIKSVTSEAEE